MVEAQTKPETKAEVKPEVKKKMGRPPGGVPKETLLWLNNLGKAATPTEGEAGRPPEEGAAGGKEAEERPPAVAPPPLERVPKVFISHSKNKTIVKQIKEMLAFGKFQFKVAEERETLAIPISEKAFGLMAKCNCAIINLSADEEKKGGDDFELNYNVLIEIGAAYLHYDRRVILLIDSRLKDKLPSNIKGLATIFYEGNELTLSAGKKLRAALAGFRDTLQSTSV